MITLTTKLYLADLSLTNRGFIPKRPKNITIMQRLNRCMVMRDAKKVLEFKKRQFGQCQTTVNGYKTNGEYLEALIADLCAEYNTYKICWMRKLK